MNKKYLYGVPIVVLIIILFLVVWKTNTKENITSTTPNPNSASAESANWWDVFGTPEYGGTLTIRASDLNSISFDPGAGGGLGQNPYLYSYESLFGIDWTLDRNIFNYKLDYIPENYAKGVLAESWELTDPTTITVHLRQGIKWQNKAPVNGRKFTSEDIIYNMDRIMGSGHGFTKPNPMLSHFLYCLDKVVAVDEYTIQIKMKNPSFTARTQMIDLPSMAPIEAVKLAEGSPSGISWQNVVGTGPWILSDYVIGSSMTQRRNPDYWGHDERFPGNQIPYIDTIKTIAIPDIATTIAALRTGKINMIPYMFNGLSIQSGQSMAKTLPDVQQSLMPQAGTDIELRCDKAPFTDIRVRKALNMALDRDSIAKAHYLGVIDGTPSGLITPLNKQFTTAFSEWPSDVQKIYTYNPKKAKQLLADAGYPHGFKTECVAPSDSDIDLLQIIKSEFMNIGVDMKITVFDRTTFMNYVNTGKQEQMCYQRWIALAMPPDVPLSMRYSKLPSPGNTFNADSKFNALFEKATSATTVKEAMPLFKKAEMYALEQSWTVNVLASAYPIAWQPYVKGYSGENMNHPLPAAQIVSRLWINKALKNNKK